jgi:hypothetical protein
MHMPSGMASLDCAKGEVFIDNQDMRVLGFCFPRDKQPLLT